MPDAGLRRVLITGASGTLGTALGKALSSRGYEIVRATRGHAAGSNQIQWDPAQPLSPGSVSGLSAVVHLAGEAIAGRWNEQKKKKILESRVLGTMHLAQAVAASSQPPAVFISASGVGYYGDRGAEPLHEESAWGQSGFLPLVCREWEAATQPAAVPGVRAVQVRTGIVLSPSGGALQAMLPAFRLGVAGNMGHGRQWWSWIHVDDWVGAVQHILEDTSLQGPVNLVAPNPVTNAEFTRILGSVLSRPTILPMPAFAARLVFGNMADELLLASQRVEPAKLLATGFRFQYPQLKPALEQLLRG